MINAVSVSIPTYIYIELPPRELFSKEGFALYEHIHESNPFKPKFGTVLSVHADESEIQVGDIVYFSYLVVESAKTQAHEGMIIKDEDRTAVLTPRENLYFIQRGEEMISLNGYSLIAPIQNVKSSVDGFRLDDRASRSLSDIEGVVRLTSHKSAKKDDLVLIEANANTPLEYDVNATKERLYRVKDIEIVGKLREKLTSEKLNEVGIWSDASGADTSMWKYKN